MRERYNRSLMEIGVFVLTICIDVLLNAYFKLPKFAFFLLATFGFIFGAWGIVDLFFAISGYSSGYRVNYIALSFPVIKNSKTKSVKIKAKDDFSNRMFLESVDENIVHPLELAFAKIKEYKQIGKQLMYIYESYAPEMEVIYEDINRCLRSYELAEDKTKGEILGNLESQYVSVKKMLEDLNGEMDVCIGDYEHAMKELGNNDTKYFSRLDVLNSMRKKKNKNNEDSLKELEEKYSGADENSQEAKEYERSRG